MIRQFMVGKGILDGMHAKLEIFFSSFNTLHVSPLRCLILTTNRAIGSPPFSKSRRFVKAAVFTSIVVIAIGSTPPELWCAWFKCKQLD